MREVERCPKWVAFVRWVEKVASVRGKSAKHEKIALDMLIAHNKYKPARITDEWSISMSSAIFKLLGYEYAPKEPTPTDEQREQMIRGNNDVHFVNSGPGTGKTTLLCMALGERAKTTGEAKHLVLTYTNAVAQNVVRKLTSLGIAARRSKWPSKRNSNEVLVITIDKLVASFSGGRQDYDSTYIFDERIRQMTADPKPLIDWLVTWNVRTLCVDEAQTMSDERGQIVDIVAGAVRTTTANSVTLDGYVLIVGDPRQQLDARANWFRRRYTQSPSQGSVTHSFRFASRTMLDHVNTLSQRYQSDAHVDLVSDTASSSVTGGIYVYTVTPDDFGQYIKQITENGYTVGVISHSFSMTNALGMLTSRYVQGLTDAGVRFRSVEPTNFDADARCSLYTMHGVAGQEFDYTFVIGMCGFPEKLNIKCTDRAAAGLSYVAQSRSRYATYLLITSDLPVGYSIKEPTPEDLEKLKQIDLTPAVPQITCDMMENGVHEYFDANKLSKLLPKVFESELSKKQLPHPEDYKLSLAGSHPFGTTFHRRPMTISSAIMRGMSVGGHILAPVYVGDSVVTYPSLAQKTGVETRSKRDTRISMSLDRLLAAWVWLVENTDSPNAVAGAYAFIGEAIYLGLATYHDTRRAVANYTFMRLRKHDGDPQEILDDIEAETSIYFDSVKAVHLSVARGAEMSDDLLATINEIAESMQKVADELPMTPSRYIRYILRDLVPDEAIYQYPTRVYRRPGTLFVTAPYAEFGPVDICVVDPFHSFIHAQVSQRTTVYVNPINGSWAKYNPLPPNHANGVLESIYYHIDNLTVIAFYMSMRRRVVITEHTYCTDTEFHPAGRVYWEISSLRLDAPYRSIASLIGTPPEHYMSSKKYRSVRTISVSEHVGKYAIGGSGGSSYYFMANMDVIEHASITNLEISKGIVAKLAPHGTFASTANSVSLKAAYEFYFGQLPSCFPAHQALNDAAFLALVMERADLLPP